MPLPSEDLGLAPDFDGTVRLFPLPNYVFFPGIVKGLHIFEPRYCAMLDDALKSDRLIAMACLCPGWENGYLCSPSVFETVCIGRVIHHETTVQRTHNILLQGLRRARIESEQKTNAGYRLAKTSLIDDGSHLSAAQIEASRKTLCAGTIRHSHILPVSAKFFLSKLHSCSLNSIVDFLSHELPLIHEQKVKLLQEPSVDKRCAWLIGYLETFDVFGTSETGTAVDDSPDETLPKVSLN